MSARAAFLLTTAAVWMLLVLTRLAAVTGTMCSTSTTVPVGTARSGRPYRDR